MMTAGTFQNKTLMTNTT